MDGKTTQYTNSKTYDMADAPQVVYDHSPPLAHSVEPKRDPMGQQSQHTYWDDAPRSAPPPFSAAPYSTQAPQQRTTLGVRRRNFCILFGIILVIAIATIGGSIGGSLAVRNSKCKSESTSTPSAAASAPSAHASASASVSNAPLQSATSAISAPSPSASVASTAFVEPASPRDVPTISSEYPSSLKDWNGKVYAATVGKDILNNDITGIFAYTLQQCIDACSTMNAMNNDDGCKAVVLITSLKREYEMNKGANCWLKSNSTTWDGVPETRALHVVAGKV